MAATDVTRGDGRVDGAGTTVGRVARRLTTETKQAFKTTEFFAYLAVLAGILVAGLMVDNGSNGYGPQEVWLHATILTIGYMISRGLAKAGSRDPYTHDRNDR